MERVACYIRVSTQEQKLHGISLDAQRDKLTDYADKHDLKIVEWYTDEGVSGRKLIKKRPQLQRMIKDAQLKKFDRILFIKLDRFFRSVAEYHECMKLIDPVIWTATEEKYDLSTANGRAFVNMKITIAELEADQTGERIKIVNDYKVKTAQAITGSHNLGIGFTIKKIDGLKRVVKNPETEAIITDFINYFIIHQSKRQAQKYINAKYSVNYSYDTICNILTDTKAYGCYRDNPNYCEPYIDKATYDKIQSIIAKNIKVPSSKRAYIFTGLIKCPLCGVKLTSVCTSKRSQTKNGKTYTYNNPIYYYRCSRHFRDNTCTYSKRLNEAKLEDLLLNNLDSYIKGYFAEVTEIRDNSSKFNPDTTNLQIEAIKSEMRNLTIAFRKSRITEAEYDRDYTALESQLAELETQLEPEVERDLSIYKEILSSDWRSLYNKLNRDNKRAFWRKYIREIKIDVNGDIDKIVFF